MIEAVSDGAILHSDRMGDDSVSGRKPMTTISIAAEDTLSSSAAVEAGVQYGLRHELVDAQVQVLCGYLEKRSPRELVAGVERLIDCCRASFTEEEGLMSRLGGQIDPVHRQRHEAVMAQLRQLSLAALDSDRAQLLGRLILIDRELIAHVAEAARMQSDGKGSVQI